MNKIEVQEKIQKILDLINEAHDLSAEIELADNQQLIKLSEAIKATLAQSSQQMNQLSQKMNESTTATSDSIDTESEVEEEISLQDKKIPSIEKKKESKND